MNRKLVYEKTSAYIQGRWLSVVGVLLIIAAINMVIGLVLGAGVISGVIALISAMATGNMDAAIAALITIGTGGLITGIIAGAISTILTGGYAIALYRAIQDDRTVTVTDVMDAVQSNLVPIIVSSIIISLITGVIGLIPFIGWIINLVVGLALGFVIYVIADGTSTDGIDAISKSFEKTKGYKLDLFVISLRYQFLPIAPMIAGFILGLLFMKLEFLSILFILAGSIGTIALSIYFIPFAITANTMLYNISKE